MRLRLPAHVLLVILGALLFVAGVDLLTGTLPPRWDGLTYVSMAEHGIYRNPDATAPFIYRPGMPFLAGALSRTLDLSTETAFRVVGFTASVLMLVPAGGWAFRPASRPRRRGATSWPVSLPPWSRN